MQLLDTIINNGISQTDNRTASRAAELSRFVGRFGRNLPFRGQLQNVLGVAQNEVQERAGLGWKIHEMPVGVIGRTETRKVDAYKALVRGDNAQTLSIVSDKFKTHQNGEILSGIQQLAAAGDATIAFAGALDGGRQIAAVGFLDGEFELPDKRSWNGHAGGAQGLDKTFLAVTISGGHEVGTPLKIRGLAIRPWCWNGAVFSQSADATVRVTHRMTIDATRLESIRQVYNRIRAQFAVYTENAQRLIATAADLQQNRLFVAELLAPGVYREVAERLNLGFDAAAPDVFTEVAQVARGRQVLDQIMRDHESDEGFARKGRQLLDSILHQEGANGPNLWTSYNGITHYVDHTRGRSAESGVVASLFGAGVQEKERALEVAVQFAR